MGILIGKKNWRGRGVAAEVIKASSMWLHNKYGIKQIILGINTGNIWAIKAYEKVGFSEKKTPLIRKIDKTNITMVWDIK